MKRSKVFAALILITLMGCFSPLASAADAELNVQKSNYDQAVTFFQENQFDSAIEHFQKALDDGHGPAAQARIYNLIGLCYLKQGVSVSSAVGSFEQAVKLDPMFAEAYFNIASAYASSGSENSKAVDYFKKTIQIDPAFYKAYFGLGWFTLMQGQDPNEAIGYFAKTLEQFPDFAEAQYGTGMAYIQLGKPHMALTAVSQLRALQRDDLASTLEQAITQISPPGDSAPLAAATASAAAPTSDSAPESGRSPFEVVLKGKVVPLPEEGA